MAASHRSYLLVLLVLLASCSGLRHSVVPPLSAPRKLMAAGTYANAVLSYTPSQYFQLNESAGPTAIDSSTTAINGAYVGSVTYGLTGPLLDETSTAISLPGGSASVGVSLPTPNAGTGVSYSIATWIYPMPTSDYTTIWGYDGRHRLLLSKTGQLLSQFYGNFFSKTTLSTGAWHEVVFVYDAHAATETYYIDGVADASAPLSNTYAAFTSAYYLGQYNTGTYYKWNGRLAQHAFFRSALTAAQVANLYTTAGYGGSPAPSPSPSPSPSASPLPSPSASPVAGNYASGMLADTPSQYFKLNETAGPTAYDSSGTAVNGTYTGAVTYGVSGPLLDEASTAIALPGGTASEGVSLPNPSASSGTSYSIETWVYPLPSSDYMTIWGYDGAHRLLLSSTGHLLSQLSGNFLSQRTLAAGQWHDVVFVYNAASATQTYYIDGTADASASLSNSYAAFTSAYYLGQYNTGTYYKWRGDLAQHAFFRSALTAAQVASLYQSAGYGAAPSPSPSPAYTDWSTFGDTLSRSSYNPNETTLTPSNVHSLHLTWSANLGAAIDAQPIVATNVPVNGTPATVLYVGAENGMFYALSADTGAVIWSQQLGAVTTACLDLPGGKFGITGTATFDRTTNRVYVADAKDNVHALDMQTGAEASGWPVNIDNQFIDNHVYGALTLNPANGLLYVSTGSFCDKSPWNGHITSINTSTASVAAQFFPASPYTGAGIWGMGGAAVDASNDVYVGTGNTMNAQTGSSAYGDHLIQFTPDLNVVAANSDAVSGDDVDFGATPMLYQPPGCGLLASIKGKAGVLPTWNTSSIANAPLQSLVMAPNTTAGEFIGVTAYSPVTNLVYVGDPVGSAPFTHGLVALAPQMDCTLSLAWQQTLGPGESSSVEDNDTPVVANGVVYFADGRNNEVYAFDAAGGTMLWNSANTIGAPVMAAPTVDGRLFIGSWDGNLYAFGL